MVAHLGRSASLPPDVNWNSQQELVLPQPSSFPAHFLEKEWPFLRACVSPLADYESIRQLSEAGLNWDVVLNMAEEHGVQGMLAAALSPGRSNLPVAAREQLQERMRAHHLITLSLTAVLFQLLEDFSKANIEVIPVKGPVLSQVAYGDAARRSFGDLDLLLKHDDMQPAIGRMAAMGFCPDVAAIAQRTDRIPGEYRFQETATGRLVELHTEKTFRHYPKPMRIGAMLQRKRQIVLDGRPVPALSLEDEVVFDCIHGGKDCWERLLWVSDIAALMVRYPEFDWEKVWTAAAEVAAERMVLVGVQLAATAFGMALPVGIARKVERDPESTKLCDEIREWIPFAGQKLMSISTRSSYRVRMAGGGISGIRYFLRLALSPTEQQWQENSTKGSSMLWDAVRRPFRLMRKYGSGE